MPFNEQQYLATNPDVARAVASGMFKSGYDHYIRFGKNEIATGKRPAAGYVPIQPATPAPAPTPQTAQQQIIDSFANVLQKQKAPTEILSESAYKDPLRAAFESSVQSTLKPQFDYSVRDPFMRQQANGAAVNGTAMTGAGQSFLQQGQNAISQKFSDAYTTAKQLYEDQIDKGYQMKLKDIGNSPSYLNNIGQ